jgi:nucleoside triphosphate pyrophosphatase
MDGSLWRAAEPLVLASASAARRQLLEQAGIPVTVRPAPIDERAVEAEMNDRDARQVALALAAAKARHVAQELPGRLVLGCDQTLALGLRLFVKPADRAAAQAQLLALRGNTHVLTSAFALVRDGTVLAHDADAALLTMREFSDGFLDAYLDAMGDKVTASVGAYQLEGLGIHLFERVEGDTSTILGLPLLAVVAALRRLNCLAE